MAEEQEKQGTADAKTSAQPASDATLDPSAARLSRVVAIAARYLTDPFSETTRERQKYLLISAILTLCLARAVVKLTGAKLEVLELDIESFNLVYVFALATLYFMVIFGVGAWQEFVAAGYRIEEGRSQLQQIAHEAAQEALQTMEDLREFDTRRAEFANEWQRLAGEAIPVSEKFEEDNRFLKKRFADAEKYYKDLKARSNDPRLPKSERAASEAKLANATDRMQAILNYEHDLDKMKKQATEDFERRQDELRSKRDAEVGSGRLEKLLDAIMRTGNDSSAERARKAAQELVTHLKLRMSVEFILPLVFGAFALVVGFSPSLHKKPRVEPNREPFALVARVTPPHSA
jgi:hypothetical protein